MIQMGTILEVADNSGARKIACIRMRGGSAGQYAGLGDITSRAIFPAKHRSRAIIDAKQDLVLCGLEIAARVFEKTDASLKIRLLAQDGDRVKKGAAVLRVEGATASILTAERTALTMTASFISIVLPERRAQFLRGLPVLRVCAIRSCVCGEPRSERKASRSRSRMSCSVTSRGGPSPPASTVATLRAIVTS